MQHYRQTHLEKHIGDAKTACGRTMFRTPVSCGWFQFSTLPVAQRCAKCDASKQAAFNLRKYGTFIDQKEQTS